MRLPLAIALCLPASQALALPAVPHLPVDRDVCGIQIPPARYDRPAKAPKIGIDGPHYVGPGQVARECKNSGFEDAVGCTTSITLGKTVVGYRVLIASNPPRGADSRCTPAKWRHSILAHERAHLNGWPADHPQ